MQHIEPNLLDSVIRNKIIQKLNPPKEEYWKPASTTAKNIYVKYVRTNIWFFVLLVAIIIFLIYRYFDIRNKNKIKIYQKHVREAYGIEAPIKKTLYDDYKDILLSAYYQQKERSREPDLALYNISEEKSKSSKYYDSIKSSTSSTSSTSSNKPMAYPSYPYSEGRLSEPKKRRK